MYSVTRSFGLRGLSGFAVAVEADVSGGLPAFSIVGLPDSAVRESADRVRAAIKNLGFKFPDRRITVNLAPADIKKEGSIYDLPLFLALLRKVILLVPLALILPRVTGSVMGIYAAEPIADILASATTLTLFLSQRKKLLPTEKDAPKG